MTLVFQTIVPVFSVIGVGWWLGGRRGTDLKTLADLSLLVASPALMFSVLAGTTLDVGQLSTLAGGTLWIAGGTALLAVGYRRVEGVGRGVLLPAVFWNAGNMGLACARLAFGPQGLEAAALIFVTMAVLSSSVGVWIAKGENGLGEALRLPLVYASVGGLALALTGRSLPRLVMEPIEILGGMAIPLMLLNLGMQLRTLSVTDVRHALAAVAIRMGGGAVFALLFVALFGVDGVDRQVLMLHSVMPAAVINVVMAQRYGTDPGLVASSIVIGTLASLVSIPAVLFFVA